MRTDEILNRPAKVLTQPQREFYFDTGYLSLPSFIGQDWLGRLWKVTERFVEESRSMAESNDEIYLEPGHTSTEPRLRRLVQPVIRDDTYWQFVIDSPLTDLAEDLLGPNVKFHHSKLNFKWHSGGGEIKWHQDAQFAPHTSYSVLTVGVYLTDVDASMGPLSVVPGSNRGPIFDLYDDAGEWTGSIREEDLATIPTDQSVQLVGPAGSATVHNNRTVHSSQPNLSDRSRVLLLNSFSSADTLPVTPYPTRCEYSGAIIRGEVPKWLHLDNEPNLIPPDWSSGYRSKVFADN